MFPQKFDADSPLAGPTRARRNPDSARNARFGSAEAMAAERSRRYVEYMPAINAYAAKTQTVRQFAAHRKGMAALRDPHRATLKKRITEMEAELKKARDDLAAMDAADAEDEKKFGDRVREGQEAELKVEKNQKFLDMEHDDEPEL